MNYETLKASIQAVIKANGNEEITGPILQQTLLAIVNALGTGYQFLGIANSGTTLGTPDQRVYYVAFAYGTSIEIGDFTIEDEICILKYDEEWTKAQIAAIDTEPTDGSDNLVTSGGVAIAIEEALRLIENAYAKKEGVYPGIVAGSAQSLLNPVALAGSFVFRPTGDGAPIGKGRAVFSELRGKSLVWNQLVNIETSTNFPTKVNSYTLQYNYSGAALFYATIAHIPSISGHKYLIKMKNDGTGILRTVAQGDIPYIPAEQLNAGYVSIVTGGGTTSSVSLTNDSNQNGTGKFYFNVFDLTLMFGEGNEPTTVADFEKMFPLPYYAYNAGKVIPFAAQDYETTGLNQWDEVAELGSINENGEPVGSTTNIRSKNYITAFGNTAYKITCKSVSTAQMVVYFYDANKVCIPYTGPDAYANGYSGSSGLFTTPNGTAFMLFRCTGAYGTTYNHDICINLSGPRNGEYEPYKKTTLHLNPAGWVDPYDNNIFPYGGMHGVGSAFDFAKVDADGYIRKATRTFGRVNMGDLNWTSGGAGLFVASETQISNILNSQDRAIICGAYAFSSATTSSGMPDKSIANNQWTTGHYVVLVKDSAYADAAAFKTAMDGVYLIFQLATPVESTLDDPVKAFTDVDGSGTEAWKPDNTADPYTTPCNVSIFYPLDIAGGVISAQSFANFCSELSTKLGAALNKTISIAATYNAATEQYGYTITIS